MFLLFVGEEINDNYGANYANMPRQVEIIQCVPQTWLHGLLTLLYLYSETLNNEYIERIHQMSYSSLSDYGLLLIFSFLIKWLYGTL